MGLLTGALPVFPWDTLADVTATETAAAVLSAGGQS